MNIIGIAKLNLEPLQDEYMRQMLADGKTWFVTRTWLGRAGRCIQASGETRDRVQKTYDNWSRDKRYRVSMIEIQPNGKVVWHGK